MKSKSLAGVYRRKEPGFKSSCIKLAHIIAYRRWWQPWDNVRKNWSVQFSQTKADDVNATKQVPQMQAFLWLDKTWNLKQRRWASGQVIMNFLCCPWASSPGSVGMPKRGVMVPQLMLILHKMNQLSAAFFSQDGQIVREQWRIHINLQIEKIRMLAEKCWQCLFYHSVNFYI